MCINEKKNHCLMTDQNPHETALETHAQKSSSQKRKMHFEMEEVGSGTLGGRVPARLHLHEFNTTLERLVLDLELGEFLLKVCYLLLKIVNSLLVARLEFKYFVLQLFIHLVGVSQLH
jgi:hypothetical protein